MDSPYTEGSFEKVQRRLLIDRLERFTNLLDLNAPYPILNSAFSHLFSAYVAYNGISSLDYISKILIDAEKSRLGFCLTCGENPNYVGYEDAPYMMCKECQNSVEEIEKNEELL